MLFHNVQMRPIDANYNAPFIFNASDPYDSIDLKHMNMFFHRRNIAFICEISPASANYRIRLSKRRDEDVASPSPNAE